LESVETAFQLFSAIHLSCLLQLRLSYLNLSLRFLTLSAQTILWNM